MGRGGGTLSRVATYRLRTTFRRRRGGYVALLLLVGVVGGVSLGAIAAARRTQSSFASYLASTNPSDLGITVFGGTGTGGGAPPFYSAAATGAIARLPGVRHVETAIPVDVTPLHADGSPNLSDINNVQPVASVDGLFSDQDRMAVTAGRLADPARPDEIVMTALAAHLYGFHVGEVIPYGIYTLDQAQQPGFGTARVPPHRRFNAKLVGLIQLSASVVQDDIDHYPTFVFLTPAFGREVVADKGQGEAGAITYGLQLVDGRAGVTAVEQEFSRIAPPGNTYGFHASAPIAAKVDRTVKPLAIALGVFGAVAALAALLIATQLIARQLHDTVEELAVLRAMGAGPSLLVADGLVGIVAAVIVGSLLAIVIAVALSPLSPLGPVRPVYPHLGIAFDWTVLGIGLATLVIGLGAITLALAARDAPHRVAQRGTAAGPRTSSAVRAVASIGLPTPAVVGVRFALEPGRGRAAVPVRSALIGAVLAVALVMATLTFSSGLQSLVSNPQLYGWNFDYMLNASNNAPAQTLSLLDRDPDVAAWQGYDYGIAQLDGVAVPFLFAPARSSAKQRVSPPTLSGHAVEDKTQIVVGAATLAQLHKRVGDTVVVGYATPGNPLYVPPITLSVVGTATMPAVGFASVVDDHTSMGTGALISEDALPTAFRQTFGNPDPALSGPNLIFVRLSRGITRATGLADLQRIADDANTFFGTLPGGAGAGYSLTVVGVQRPAEIVNYRNMGATPALLASALAVGAVIALGLTLTASVRRRRRDLALLKTLGFTHLQIAATVAWQASVAAVVGIGVGLPLGIAAGRWLWTLFAREIYAVPHPTVPVGSVALVAVGAVVLANVVSALPGRSAARTPTATLLRAD